MPLKILAAADLHLGRRSKHLPVDASEAISSPIPTWRRLVDEAIRREVDLVCLTGDIVDESNKFFEAFGPLIQGLRRLDEHAIATCLVAGNHDFDVLGELVDQVDVPTVRLLGRNGTWESVSIDRAEESVTVTGWSFPARHFPRNPMADFPATGDADGIAVGLLHCDLEGAEEKYAPVRRSDFEETSVDCWLLGHIHKPSLYENSATVLYPGSPHALDNGEQGAHGPWLVTIRSSQDVTAELLPLSPVRYESLGVDVSSVETREDWRIAIVSAVEDRLKGLAEDLQEAEVLMCDITLEGRTASYEAIDRWIDAADTDEFTYHASGTTAHIHKIRNRARPAVGDLDALAVQENPAGYLARVIQTIEQEEDSELVEELVRRIRPVFQRIDSSSTYTPLRSEAPLDRTTVAVTEQILDRSRELLATLLDQKD